jgi:predicted Zn-dependent protease
MSRFENNQNHRLGGLNENRFQSVNPQLASIISSAIPVHIFNGQTEEEYQNSFERKPLWQLSGFEDEKSWAEFYKPKIITTTTLNDVTTNSEEPQNILLTIQEEPEPEPLVKQKVTDLEKNKK